MLLVLVALRALAFHANGKGYLYWDIKKNFNSKISSTIATVGPELHILHTPPPPPPPR